jgi:hypothetical protein
MRGWAAARLDEVPPVTDGDPGDPEWRPLQHAFGLTAFGANAFVARAAGEQLVHPHDERASGQEELYVVLEGTVAFEVGGERLDAVRGTVVAVRDPALERSAVARSAGAALLVVGAAPGAFASTWQADHFRGLRRLVDDA